MVLGGGGCHRCPPPSMPMNDRIVTVPTNDPVSSSSSRAPVIVGTLAMQTNGTRHKSSSAHAMIEDP